MDVHNCLNRIIQAINPATASRRPAALYQLCRFAVGEVAVGRFQQHFGQYRFLFKYVLQCHTIKVVRRHCNSAIFL